MAYPTVGVEGSVVSWAGAFYTALLSGIRPARAGISITNPTQETTALGSSVSTSIPGLGQWSGSMSGTGFATPRLGNQGLVTFSAGGYALYCNRWRLDLSASGPHDITEFNATAPTWRRFRPDYLTGSFSFDCKVDNATAIVAPHLAGATLPTLTLRYGDSGTDETISGSAIIENAELGIARGEPNTVTYSGRFTSTITPAGTASILGTSALGIPLWDQGSAGTTALVVAALTGSRTYSGDAFYTGISIEAEVGQPVSVEVNFQGTNALTIA